MSLSSLAPGNYLIRIDAEVQRKGAPLVAEVLTETQQQHTDCRPFFVAIELQQDQLALELLVRTKRRVRCACMAYAAENQRIWLLDLVDAIFRRLDIIT